MDNHASIIGKFTLLLEKYRGNHNLFIHHLVYGDHLKTCLFFDIAHLIENIRNNYLNRTKSLFSEHHFYSFDDAMDTLAGYISWGIFYDDYKLDKNLQRILPKAPNLTYKAAHEGNNKQDISFVLATFDEATAAAVFNICNSKQQCHTSNMLGNATIGDDIKSAFLYFVASLLEN